MRLFGFEGLFLLKFFVFLVAGEYFFVFKKNFGFAILFYFSNELLGIICSYN